MKITILSVGKIKEKYLKMAIDEYSKRLSKYCKLNIIEVADEKTSENMSEAEERMIKEKEGQKILKNIKGNEYVVALAIDGKQRSSVKMSEWIGNITLRGNSHIVFVIGGSIGLSDDVLNIAKEKISFSKLTFPHQLMRVILLEQIYRSFRIAKNEPYHK